MRPLVRWSLTFPLVVIALVAGLLVFAATQLTRMPVDALPEFDAPYVEVQTEALGLSAAEVEQFITVPMENLLLTGVAWVERVRSESITGLSSITLIFEPGTDLLLARQVVQERLTQSHALPNVSKPPAMIQPLSSTSRVMIVELTSDELSAIRMSELARWNIRPHLMGLTGVANVAIWGHRERQLQVQVDPERLHAAGVTLEQVVRTTGNSLWFSPLSYLNASTPGSGGFIDTPNQRFGIRHVLPIRTPADLEQVPIEGSDRRLGEVTTIVEDHQPLIGDALPEGGSTLLLVIEKLPGANMLQVTQDVEGALDSMRAGLAGIEIDTGSYRPAGFVESAIANVGIAALVGLLLLALTLAVVLRGIRVAVVALVSIALSLASAAAILLLTGATANVLLVAGLALALAIVIDDAILGAHDLRMGLRRVPRDGNGAVLEGIADIVARRRTPLLFALATVVLAVIPVFALPGETAALLQPLVIAYLVAVGVSMLVALIVTPLLARVLLTGPAPAQPEAASSLGLRYRTALRGAMGHPWRALVAVAIVMAIGIAAIPALSFTMTPQLRERNLLVDVRTAPGMSRAEILRLAERAATELEQLPGITDVDAHVGRAIMSDAVVGMDAGQLWINVAADANYDATVAGVQRIVAGYPGLDMRVGSYLADQAAAVLGRAEEPLAVRVFGPDLAVLRGEADRVREAVAGVQGVSEAVVAQEPVEPQVEVEVDIAVATKYGLKPGDVRRQAATLLSGLEVGNLFEDQKIFEVVVWGVEDVRTSLTDIRGLLLDTPSGQQVALEDVASVRIGATPSVIRREGISRFVEVLVATDGRDRGAVAADIQTTLAGLSFPQEYHPEVVQPATAGSYLPALVAGLAAILGILLILQAALGSWRVAALCLAVIPAALAGAAVATLLAGGTATLGTVFAALAIVALAIRAELDLVDRLNDADRASPPSRDDVIAAASDRLVPTLATTAALMAVLLPLLVLRDQPGIEILAPMAIAIIGGLITMSPLVLFAVPVLYAHFGGSAQPAQPAPQAPTIEPQRGPQPAGVS